MSFENNKMQVDIENLFKQNVNDLSSIKELYRKIQDIENKISQIKYIDNNLANKLKKEYESLKCIILDENIQAKLTNDIETIDVKLTNEIETINSQLDTKASLKEVVTKGNVDLDEMTERTLQAIKGGGETSFELLSIPRDNSVNYNKLDNSIKNSLFKVNKHDDTNIVRKGSVGSNDIYFINHEYTNCNIVSITIKCSDVASGEVRIYDNADGVLTLTKSIEFNTTNLGTLEPKIDLNYKCKSCYIGLTKTSGNVDFGEINTYGMLTFDDKISKNLIISKGSIFDNYSLNASVEFFETDIVKKEELSNYVTKEDIKNIDKNLNSVFTVVAKDGTGDFTTITEAIANYNGKPIYIKNGIYEDGRINCDDKTVVMIGEDKYRTIIKNKNGLYGEDCLYCSNGVFSNLQFISEYVNGESTEIGQQNGAYAVHVDSNNQAEGICTFNDCIIISDFNAAVGNGLRKNNTVEFNNCDLISRQEKRGQNFENGGMGALFTHNNHTGTGDNCPNQIIRLNNCRLKAKLKNVIKIQEISKNNAEAILDINNCLIYSETNGVTDVIKYDNYDSFDEMSIWKLSDTSYGNTVKELNKF